MPEKNEAFEEIEKHRAEIDAIDQKLVALLNERAGHSLDIVATYNEGPLYNENLTEIYRGILKVMKEVPSRD